MVAQEPAASVTEPRTPNLLRVSCLSYLTCCCGQFLQWIPHHTASPTCLAGTFCLANGRAPLWVLWTFLTILAFASCPFKLKSSSGEWTDQFRLKCQGLQIRKLKGVWAPLKFPFPLPGSLSEGKGVQMLDISKWLIPTIPFCCLLVWTSCPGHNRSFVFALCYFVLFWSFIFVRQSLSV